MLETNEIQAKNKGFTLVEILIVSGILAAIATVTFLVVSDSLGKSRDSQRVQEAEAIAESMNLYLIDNGSYACESDGYNGEIGVGNSIDDILEVYLPDVPADPLYDGTTYYYYYDANHGCLGGPTDQYFITIMVAEFETDLYKERYGNLSSVCPYTWGSEGPTSPDYVVQLFPACE